MRRLIRRSAPSALTAIGGFSVAVAVLSVGTTASIVLLMPDPPAIRVTVADAAAALRGAASSLERRAGPPPAGTPAPLLQHALARELGTVPSKVRVVWLDNMPARTRSEVIVLAAPRTGARTQLRLRPEGDRFLLRPEAGGVQSPPTGIMRPLTGEAASALVSRLIAHLPQPAFAAGVLDARGQWISVAPSRPFWSGWRLKVVSALAVSLLLLAPLAWLFARRLTRPFRSLAAAIDTGSEPPRLDGPRELRDAAGAIVQLRTRLALEADERMRMLTAVAHDLRTPLTSLKLRIESVAEPQRSRMVADADRMQVMIHDVLAFARVADAPREPVPVRALVADVIADVPGAEGKVLLAAGTEVSVTVVKEAFRRALENLVRNALDHADGGRVDVLREGPEVAVAVVDSGPGIVAGERERLVRPFERGERSRNRDTGGVGLGLSIVQSFADLHGGSLTLADAPGGGGTAAVLRLPADKP